MKQLDLKKESFTLLLDTNLPESTLKNYKNSNYFFICKTCKKEFVDLNHTRGRIFCSATCRKRIMPAEEKIRRSVIAKEKGFGKWMLGRHLSTQAKKKISEKNKGRLIGIHLSISTEFKSAALHPNWKHSNDLTYAGIHSWLRTTFGKAKECEFCHCKNAKRYDWAKLKHKKYERKRENFWQLCKSCHIKYDRYDYKLDYAI